MGSSTWEELASTLTSTGGAYVRARNAFVTSRPELVGIIAARGLRLHGRRLPLSWTSDDLRSEASISLLTLIDALRLHGTALPPGWRRQQLGSAQLLERLDGKSGPVIDPRVLRPDRVEAFLVQWAAPATRQSLDDDEFDVSGRRRELRLRKAMLDLSESRASLVSADESAQWANARNAEIYGIAAATQDRVALAIARSTDLEPTDELERESISAQVRDRVASAVPGAIADRRAVAGINRRMVAEHGLARAAESCLLVRPSDLIGSSDGVRIREAESAAIRTRLLDWSRQHPCESSDSVAVSYTIAQVIEIGTRRLRRSGIHLTSADLQPTYPQLIGPERDWDTARVVLADPQSHLHFGLLRDEILANVAVQLPGPSVQLAHELIECVAHGLPVRCTRQAAQLFGFSSRAAMIAALSRVSTVARQTLAVDPTSEPILRAA